MSKNVSRLVKVKKLKYGIETGIENLNNGTESRGQRETETNI